jgi:excisionase family DNA binding protein
VEEFLTVAELAAILKLNQQSVLKNWIDAGQLPAVHVGRRLRIKASRLGAAYRGGLHRSEARRRA